QLLEPIDNDGHNTLLAYVTYYSAHKLKILPTETASICTDQCSNSLPLIPSILSDTARRRSEVESKDPEEPHRTMPLQGVLYQNPYPLPGHQSPLQQPMDSAFLTGILTYSTPERV